MAEKVEVIVYKCRACDKEGFYWDEDDIPIVCPFCGSSDYHEDRRVLAEDDA